MINPTPMRDLVRFVTITTDPKNDTPEVMRKYGPARGLEPVNWMFLTSGPEKLAATRKLVERFGHKFTKDGDGYQLHSVVTHVIDMEGRWRANFHGLKFQPTNLVLFINALTNDVHEANKQRKQGLWEKLRKMF
jgi:protein SCO1/2